MIHEHNLGPPQAAGDAMCWHQVATASVCQLAFGSYIRIRSVGSWVDCGVKLPRQPVAPDSFGDGNPG